LLAFALVTVGWIESETSALQARVLSWVAKQSQSDLAPGRNAEPLQRPDGPYDQQAGYSSIQEFTDNLEKNGFEIVAQSTPSPMLRKLTGFGITPPYREKSRPGLEIVDARGASTFAIRTPERGYTDFDEIPQLLVDSLLFIENRQLFDPATNRNPAVEWPRLARATLEWGTSRFSGGGRTAGASTLATQLEKLRHSPAGLTDSPREKLRQMASASLRAYVGGRNTTESRENLVADYLSNIKLAAVPGHGEVVGLPMGLALWYGANYNIVGKLIDAEADHGWALQSKAYAYRQALGLVLAAGRPHLFLVQDTDALRARTDRFLNMLCDAGVISSVLRDAALAANPEFKLLRYQSHSPTRDERDGARPTRTHLLDLLGLDSLYELDRIDARIQTTTYDDIETEVQATLDAVRDPNSETAIRLHSIGLLNSEDPRAITLSFSLYERTDTANKLRVYSDTRRASRSVDESIMLDLGSTAKLRTLATYLEIVAEIYDRDDLVLADLDKRDALGRWALERRAEFPHESRQDFLEAAMDRSYSASPRQRFFTGRGLHTFGNFRDSDDYSVFSVRNATRHSINLVFVRLLRDMVAYRVFSADADKRRIMSDVDHPLRLSYLERSAIAEGGQFIREFHRRYTGLTPHQIREQIFTKITPTPRRAAVLIRLMQPKLTVNEFIAEYTRWQDGKGKWRVNTAAVAKMHADYDPSRFDRNDLAHLAGLDWLHLWTVNTMATEPGISVSDLLSRSRVERIESFAWLYTTRKKAAQDRRIFSELEVDVFDWMHEHWASLGYPFKRLVPSLATVLGASADRPAALAELMGIIQADGMRLPTQRLERVRLATNTPYDTIAIPKPQAAKQVMGVEVARTLKGVLIDVAAQGTARRTGGTLTASNGQTLYIGGKTGTGDHSRKTIAADGSIISEIPISRSGVFPFLIGDRHFGAVTVYVEGPYSDRYEFTSSLATEVFRMLRETLVTAIASGQPHSTPDVVTAQATGNAT
jgi:membrane peptidoglycan carboxypeptidase